LTRRPRGANSFERHLADAGFHDVEASWFEWGTEYPDLESWWECDTGFGPLEQFFDGLDDHQRSAAHGVMVHTLSEHRTTAGGYLLPAKARAITARR
jgi:hypothetical protein